MGKRSSGASRAAYAFKRAQSERDYRAQRGPDNGAGAAAIIAKWHAGEKVESYRPEHEQGIVKAQRKTADPA